MSQLELAPVVRTVLHADEEPCGSNAAAKGRALICAFELAHLKGMCADVGGEGRKGREEGKGEETGPVYAGGLTPVVYCLRAF